MDVMHKSTDIQNGECEMEIIGKVNGNYGNNIAETNCMPAMHTPFFIGDYAKSFNNVETQTDDIICSSCNIGVLRLEMLSQTEVSTGKCE